MRLTMMRTRERYNDLIGTIDYVQPTRFYLVARACGSDNGNYRAVGKCDSRVLPFTRGDRIVVENGSIIRYLAFRAIIHKQAVGLAIRLPFKHESSAPLPHVERLYGLVAVACIHPVAATVARGQVEYQRYVATLLRRIHQFKYAIVLHCVIIGRIVGLGCCD